MALDRLEVYMLAADNPIGKKQLRPIFKRKRSKEVLTREQVTAIKKGRKVLRREMKEQGLKNRVDFEVTATNLNLYFDRHRLLWPIFLWFARSHTVAKVLATTAVLATAVTVTEPVIRYVQQVVNQFVDRDRFTISVDEYAHGFELTETILDITKPNDAKWVTALTCEPAVGIPCVSIQDIPENVTTIDGEHHDTYFAYTFYCRYKNTSNNQALADYQWKLNLNEETKDLSTATWIMVFHDDNIYDDAEGKMEFFAERGTDGLTEAIPAVGTENEVGAYTGAPLMELCADPESQYELIKEGSYYDYYRVIPKDFVSDSVAAEGDYYGIADKEIHKFTVVIWLEGDDPECTDEMIGAHIGMNFKIQLVDDVSTGNAAS